MDFELTKDQIDLRQRARTFVDKDFGGQGLGATQQRAVPGFGGLGARQLWEAIGELIDAKKNVPEVMVVPRTGSIHVRL